MYSWIKHLRVECCGCHAHMITHDNTSYIRLCAQRLISHTTEWDGFMTCNFNTRPVEHFWQCSSMHTSLRTEAVIIPGFSAQPQSPSPHWTSVSLIRLWNCIGYSTDTRYCNRCVLMTIHVDLFTVPITSVRARKGCEAFRNLGCRPAAIIGWYVQHL